MTTATIALAKLAEKGADIDVLRQGSYFPEFLEPRRTAEKALTAVMLEQNDEWSLNRAYMQLEGLQTVSDTAPTRLPAVAR